MSLLSKFQSTTYRFKPQPDITAYELAEILRRILFDRLTTVTVADDKAENFAPFARHFERKD